MIYCFKTTEKKWQKYWSENKTYQFIDEINKPKFYILDMFPYPSGSGLHVGHIKGYLATDIYARYKKMKGFCVLHPMGWDAFGLPAEQYAIKHNKDPGEFTLKNIDNFRKQLQELSFSYDFELEINTCEPSYYEQTQWIFSELYKHKMAELSWTYVNWCPELNTVLANEEILIENGQKISERGGFPVYPKKLQQWLLKITKYSERLLNDIDSLEWNDNIKKIQQNWIDKKEQYQFTLLINGKEYFVNLNKESDIEKLKGINIHAFSSAISDLKINISELKDQEKLNIQATISFNKKNIPVYFLSNVDFRSDDLMPILDEEKNDSNEQNQNQYECKKVITYKLKDWVFSRQRYWGEPFPIYYNKKKEVFLDEKLPVVLPKWNDKEAFEKWYNIDENHVRDTNTMPNWAGSSWYFLAYILRTKDTNNKYLKLYSEEAKQKIKRWMPVDIYVGGQEHANLHLLYSRFWYKFLNDIGIVSNNEPFKKLINQGMILAEDGSKMSKSKNNVINTTDIFEEYGSDVFRLNMAFMGPTELSQKWENKQLIPLKKWLEKMYLFFNNLNSYEKIESDEKLSKSLIKLINNSENAIQKFKLNVIVSELMIFFNSINELKKYSVESLKTFLKILSFLAPSFAEEIWFSVFKENKSIYLSEWPKIKSQDSNNAEKEMQIHINNVFKQTCLIDMTKSQEEIVKYLSQHENLKKFLQDKKISKIYIIPQKMINIIVQ